MRNPLLNKKAFAILGIVFILIGIPLTIYILKNQTILKSQASASEEPQNIKITNISDNLFTITYQTNVPTTGSINYGQTPQLGESGLDDIDKEKGSFSPKKVHSVSIKELTPSTKYYLTVNSGSNTFLNNGVPFKIITGPEISSPSAKQKTAKGKIILPNGSPASETTVFLNAENSQLLSGLTNENGEFNLSLDNIRTYDLSSYFSMDEGTVFTIVATDGSLKSTVSTTLDQIASVPTITLSNDYNFIQKESLVATESTEKSNSPTALPQEEDLKPEIKYPKEKQTLNSSNPQFSGTSLPNEKVDIVIHSSEEITAQVTADSDGNWTYRPSTNLSPGPHTITIKTPDSSGILTTIMQPFVVFAADSETPISTPSSNLAPSPSLPSMIITTPTAIPTLTPSPIQSSNMTKGGLPPTGSSSIPLVAGGAISIILGFTLLLFTRKISL